MKNLNNKSIALITALSLITTSSYITKVFAKSLFELPVTQRVEYIFDTYDLNQNNIEAKIQTLKINGFKSKELENNLNTRFIKEAQLVYDEFIKSIDESENHKFLGLHYKIKADNLNVLSILSTKLNIEASSSTEISTYVVDKQKQALISLSDLFKDKSYIQLISDDIKAQMRALIKTEGAVYNIDSNDTFIQNFNEIKPNQSFYINDKNQLVIVFNQFEVAPGYMGTPEFVIKIDVIQNILVNNSLIN